MTTLLFNADDTVDLMRDAADPARTFRDTLKSGGLIVEVDLITDGEQIGVALVTLGYSDPSERNMKAEKAILMLTGQHIILPGPVFLHGLDPDVATEVLGSL